MDRANRKSPIISFLGIERGKGKVLILFWKGKEKGTSFFGKGKGKGPTFFEMEKERERDLLFWIMDYGNWKYHLFEINEMSQFSQMIVLTQFSQLTDLRVISCQ